MQFRLVGSNNYEFFSHDCFELVSYVFLQGVVGSERSLKTAVVSLFVEGVMEIEGDEKGGRCGQPF